MNCREFPVGEMGVDYVIRAQAIVGIADNDNA